MMWFNNNKGGLIITLAAVLFGIFLGLILSWDRYRAEAVVGGVGNLGDWSISNKHLHNLSSNASTDAGRIRAALGDTGTTEICIFCHTPHRAIENATLINAPLWNHSLSTASYDLNGVPSTLINTSTIVPDGAAKLCLSCHDGTVGIGATNTKTIEVIGDCLDADGSLEDDPACPNTLGLVISHHIFSVPMNTDLRSNSITLCQNGTSSTWLKYPWEDTVNAPAQPNDVLLRPTAQSYISNTGIDGADVPVGGGKYTAGYKYGVQCSTCHDPHLYWEYSGSSCKYLVAGACSAAPAGWDPLCLACHSSDCP
jgi:hypothetical protein